MNVLTKAKGLADPYNPRSLAGQARAKRGEWLVNTFPELAEMRVLDLGGRADAWESLPVRPASLVMINTREFDVPEDWPVQNIIGDACDPPAELRRERFDLVYSNSVLEHVGGHWRRERFAETVHMMADRHWVQTPNRYFPLEPHWLFPGLQFFPTAMKAWITRRWPGRYYAPTGSFQERMWWAFSVELLTKAEMQFYFPESEIQVEHVGPLPKSLIAIKR